VPLCGAECRRCVGAAPCLTHMRRAVAHCGFEVRAIRFAGAFLLCRHGRDEILVPDHATASPVPGQQPT
jgi:hypothetical protein